MSKALAWIRKSKGSDDDIGLEMQREKVKSLAESTADDVDVLDLGVQTGFSTMSREGDSLLDQREDVQKYIQLVRQEEFDYIVAYDDTRVARDEYLSVIEYACVQGNCEIIYVADISDDDLTHNLRRSVEMHAKKEEIQKSREAIKERQRRGYDQGHPPTGFVFDEDGKHWVPGPNFDEAVKVIQMKEEGHTYSEIIEETIVDSSATVSKILNENRSLYEEHRQKVEN